MARKPISYEKITVPQIRGKLREKGLPVSGTKQVLYDRLYGSSSKPTDKPIKSSKNKRTKRESDSVISQKKTKHKGQRKKQRLSRSELFSRPWRNVCKKLAIDTNPVIDKKQFPVQQPDEDDLQILTSIVKDTILRRERHQADAFGFGVHTRAFYVMAMLDEVMDYFEYKEFIINVQHPLGSPGELIFTPRNPQRSPIGFVVEELPKDDFEQGRAQLYLQLKAAHKENAENGSEFDVFGALTTADIWVFVLYNGENFYETSKCVVSYYPKFAGLNVVVAWLAAILDYVDDHMSKNKK